MNYLTILILVFSVLGALDRICGCRFGLGKEFEKAFNLLGVMALSMIGMIVISPVIADWMKPLSTFLAEMCGIDASVVPALLFANDMGGASLAVEMGTSQSLAMYNALVVSSMMGCTVSFTIPYALGVVGEKQKNDLLMGILCGIVTIPTGCFVSGIICNIPFFPLVVNLIPIVVLAVIIALGLFWAPDRCVKIFKVFGMFITALITVGLALGILNFLAGDPVVEGLATLEEGASVCVNAAVVLSGSFPLMYVVSKLLSKPLRAIGKKRGMNEISVIGFVSSLASSATSFGMMDKMDRRGVVLNSAFAVSGAFVLGSHLAFTLAFDGNYVLPVLVGKMVSGVTSVILANIIYNKTIKKSGET